MPLTPIVQWAAVVAVSAALAACSGLGSGPSMPAANTASMATASDAGRDQAFLERATQETVTRDGVTVRVAALRNDEVAGTLGLPLADIGVQPVWVEISNDSPRALLLMPAFLDRDFYTAREVAHLLGSSTGRLSKAEATQELVAREINNHVNPGETARGFVYTNTSRGIKLINIELLGLGGLQRFEFARDVPEGHFDYENKDPTGFYPAEQVREVPVSGLPALLAGHPCCTTNAAGDREGDPLNLAVIGDEHDVLVALVRSGWDFTESINAASVQHMVKAFLFGGEFPTSPVSALYFDGRAQDFAMQRARKHISQRSHLRLWITPYRIEGKPLWIGQVSRDIGVKVTRLSPTFTTHVVDPNVDEAREYLLQSLLMTGNVDRWGLVPGVGAASQAEPRQNLGADPYFTDGDRLVLFIAKAPRAVGDVQHMEWTGAD